MIEIDGAAGGGQILRSALSLAAISGTGVDVGDIRGNRSNPGLRPQHVAVVELLGEICDATVSDVAEGTRRLTFEPGTVREGTYWIDIGTAGSVTLLCDALLPLATIVSAPIEVHARGGTDVKWSPSTGFLADVKLPLLARHGLCTWLSVDRYGFYPAGGGLITLRVCPSHLDSFDLIDRGEIRSARVSAVATPDLSDANVAERHVESAVQGVCGLDIDVDRQTVTYAAADSTGSAVLVRLDSSKAIAGFDGLGAPGVPAEDVSARVVSALDEYLHSGAIVDAHMADQLLPYLALGGGALDVPTMTDHLETQLDVIRAFGYRMEVERRENAITLRARTTDSGAGNLD